tara:strand:+ start:3860 stop:4447 length:588 start_codon:yes stop_codon:yes gene_type:complete
MIDLDKQYWERRWEEHQTGWDIGSASTPLVQYFEQLTDKSITILIPGCGNAYEAEVLIEMGFKNTFVIDISKKALESFKERLPNFPIANMFCEDFFSHQKQYDLILEQTFFCALNPNLREKYCLKASSLLKDNGRLVGVLFNEELFTDHPPFGGFKKDYLPIFKNYFDITTFEECYNSIKPRANRELFINVRKQA